VGTQIYFVKMEVKGSKIQKGKQMKRKDQQKSKGSLGGQVGYSPDFHPGCPGSTPARGDQQKKMIKKHLVCLKNDFMLQGVLKKYFFKNCYHLFRGWQLRLSRKVIPLAVLEGLLVTSQGLFSLTNSLETKFGSKHQTNAIKAEEIYIEGLDPGIQIERAQIFFLGLSNKQVT